MPGWINFKELRSKLKFEDVLGYYKVTVKRKRDQHLGFCPLPNHNGKKNSQSFSAHLERGIFHCFGCGAKGDLLKFAALMERVDPTDGTALHGVALKLQQQFCPEFVSTSQQPKKATAKKTDKPEPERELPVIVNAPLDFDLKGLDYTHPYLRNRGFSQETIDHFGLGFCSRGYHKDRVVIPLEDHNGQTIGYAGRVVDDSLTSKDNPRYRFPGERKRDGKIIEFRKSLFLYNGFRIQPPVRKLIVVESFTALWWLYQNKLRNVVGTMGSDCSDKQAELIVLLTESDSEVWIMTDGDPAGERCATDILTRVSPYRFVRWVKLKEGLQPTDLSPEGLTACFEV